MVDIDLNDIQHIDIGDAKNKYPREKKQSGHR